MTARSGRAADPVPAAPDDGIGFDPAGLPGEPVDGTGFGLTGMRQRVARVAGRLEIESAPGEGTAVSATVPAIPA